MTLDRRKFMQSGIAATAVLTLPQSGRADIAFEPHPGAWRTFEVVTRMEIANPDGKSQAWIPVPAVNEQDWFKSLGSTWTSNGRAALAREPRFGAEMVRVDWQDGETKPVVEITSKIATRDRAIDLAAPDRRTAMSAQERAFNLRGTQLIPVDGIVKQTADKIVAGARTDVEKARAIYEWAVDNTFRDANVRGCGIGDIATMLRTGNLGGKCADINALYVGLARASGLPARDIYGVRVAPSKFGYKSLGANSESVTKAQHCRAEVYLADFGWVPVDPADVRKVVLEEPPTNLAMNDAKVAAARKTLFGAWEGNWLAYNFGHDIALPGSDGPKIGFLMYPQAETAGSRVDCLDPDHCRYTISARELSGT
jgi:transglutaminase-like putative cysteine protease